MSGDSCTEAKLTLLQPYTSTVTAAKMVYPGVSPGFIRATQILLLLLKPV